MSSAMQVTVAVDDSALADPYVNSGARPARNRKASRSVSSMTAGSSGCRGASSSWICRVLVNVVRPAAVQRIPAALFGNLRAAGRGGVLSGENPCHLARGPATGACERTSADSRRAAGMRRITTR